MIGVFCGWEIMIWVNIGIFIVYGVSVEVIGILILNRICDVFVVGFWLYYGWVVVVEWELGWYVG